MRRFLIHCVLLGLPMICLAGPDSSPPTMLASVYRGGEARTGFVNAPIAPPLSLLWRFTTDVYRSNYSTPVVSPDGRIFFASNKDVYALEAETGAQIWEKPYEMVGPVAAPLVFMPPNYLLVGTKDSQNSLLAVNCDTGGLSWAFNAGGAVYSSPIVLPGNRIIFGATNNRVYGGMVGAQGLSDESGGSGQPWHIELGGSVRGAIATANGSAFVHATDDTLYAIDLSSTPKKVLWKRAVGSPSGNSGPVIMGDQVVVATANRLFGFSVADGRQVWTRKLASGARISGSPVVNGTMLYFGAEDEYLYSYDAARQRSPWTAGKVKLDGRALSSPAGSSRGIFIGTARGLVQGISIDDGAVQWSYKLAAIQEANFSVTATPLIADGRVYVVGDDGSLFCFSGENVDVGTPEVLSATLRVRARDRKLTKYDIEEYSEDMLEDELFLIPGTPPLSLEFKLEDWGSGIKADTFRVTLDNRKRQITRELKLEKDAFNPIKSTLSVDVGPRAVAVGTTVNPLEDGLWKATLRVKNWAGHELVDVRAFVVDRSAPPPGPPSRRSTQPDLGGGLGGRSGFDRPRPGGGRGGDSGS